MVFISMCFSEVRKIRDKKTLQTKGGFAIVRLPLKTTTFQRDEKEGQMDVAHLWPDAIKVSAAAGHNDPQRGAKRRGRQGSLKINSR
jgi:hypothetical protein